MNVNNAFVAAITLCCLMSCRSANKEPFGKAGVPIASDYEIYSLYEKGDSTLKIARAVEKGRNSFELTSYEILLDSLGDNIQHVQFVEKLTGPQIEHRRAELNSTYDWFPRGEQLLFVQIQANTSTSDLDLLDIRQKIEDEIDDRLHETSLGEWAGGDLGPGGANMLFNVIDVNKSVQLILEVLQQYGLGQYTRIGKRIKLSDDNWVYLVIYPADFSGKFDTR